MSGPVATRPTERSAIVNADQKRKLDQLDQEPHPELHVKPKRGDTTEVAGATEYEEIAVTYRSRSVESARRVGNWGMSRLYECISEMKKGSPSGYDAETGDESAGSKSSSGEPHEQRSLYRTPAVGPAVTFDKNGNQTGQIANKPTQSWTENTGSVEFVLSTLPTLA
jgi:hypothetical protein